jgi:hypothetical protein
MTLTDKETYHILRAGITSGLANVGITEINKFKFENGFVYSYDTPHTMTHICGCDFSSLYPSVCSSNSHPFVKYTGGKMWMPGYQVKRMCKTNSTEEERKKVIMNSDRFSFNFEIISKLPFFVAVVKGHILEEKINNFINFPPIIKILEIRTDKETIGEYMY